MPRIPFHVRRMSTGVHDPLLSSALFLDNGTTTLIFVANDALNVTKSISASARKRIRERTGVPEERIMLTATHTHSAPTILPVDIPYDHPVPDPAYIQRFEDGIVEAAAAAFRAAQPAEIGFAKAHMEGVGTNRRSPDDPADPDAPALMVRNAETRRPIAVMVVYARHPTVLHEDSTLAGADFPGQGRRYLQRHVLGADCPVLHHNGASGNQSPRHCVRAQTFEEAERIGVLYGQAVEKALEGLAFQSRVVLDARQTMIESLPIREIPSLQKAEEALFQVKTKFDRQKADGPPRAIVRTTECDVFGAETSVRMARAVADGSLRKEIETCLPATLQAFQVGEHLYIGWPGEFFVEFALRVRATHRDAFVITCANDILMGCYIVTREAAEEAAATGGYEASNAIFLPTAGDLMVEKSLELASAILGSAS